LEDLEVRFPSFSISEVAGYLQLHRASVYAIIARGELRAVGSPPRLRVGFWDFIEYLAERYRMK
jgi:excisionase family DNA binding protein